MIHTPLQEQIKDLQEIILINPIINKVLNNNPFPYTNNWYLGAGCVCQTVWNHLLGNEITYGIEDYDLVYYDKKDISKETEVNEQERINKLFKDLSVSIEVVNEARVHLWFEEDFGKKLSQYKSVEDAINQWPTTATAIAVSNIDGTINVYAPYGLNDLFGMIVRPNKPWVIKEVYEKKVAKWIKKWPTLQVIPWEQM